MKLISSNLQPFRDIALGMYVAVDKKVTVGLPIELTIVFPDYGVNMVEVMGRIDWVNNKNEQQKPDFPSGFGVQFLEFKEETEELFKSFVKCYIPSKCP